MAFCCCEKTSNSLVCFCTLILDEFSSLYSFLCVLGCGKTRVLTDPQTYHMISCLSMPLLTCSFLPGKSDPFYLHIHVFHTCSFGWQAPTHLYVTCSMTSKHNSLYFCSSLYSHLLYNLLLLFFCESSGLKLWEF